MVLSVVALKTEYPIMFCTDVQGTAINSAGIDGIARSGKRETFRANGRQFTMIFQS